MGVFKLTAARLAWLLVFVALPICGGCALVANVAHTLMAERADAAYSGLEEKRVAVVCVLDSAPYGGSSTSETLARFIELTLVREVDDIELVPYDEVANWTDSNDASAADYTDIGREVNADRVLVIELSSYSLHDGRTLYKGKADVDIAVYDVEKDKRVFHRKLTEFQFPTTHGRPMDTSERRFEQKFLRILSQKISNYFYDYELSTEFAQDASMLD